MMVEGVAGMWECCALRAVNPGSDYWQNLANRLANALEVQSHARPARGECILGTLLAPG